MKKLLSILMAIMVAGSMAACGSSEAAPEEAPETPAVETPAEESEEAPAEKEETEEAPEEAPEQELMQVGNNSVGYVSIPADWVEISQNDLMQYADPGQKYALTMNSTSLPNGTAADLAQSVKENMETNGMTNTALTEGDCNGMAATILTGNLEDVHVVCWFIQDGNTVYFPSMEGPEKDLDAMAAYVSSSFSATAAQ